VQALESQRRALFAQVPNLITLARLLLVPIVIALIASENWVGAALGFAVAGVSDGVDGYIARRFDLRSKLGAYLDAIADKALLISIFVTLALIRVVPPPLAILVVSRDVMIMGAVMISLLLEKPVEIKPLFISKLNTTVQILFATLVLGAKAFAFPLGMWFHVFIYAVAILTLASALAYLARWLRHMAD